MKCYSVETLSFLVVFSVSYVVTVTSLMTYSRSRIIEIVRLCPSFVIVFLIRQSGFCSCVFPEVIPVIVILRLPQVLNILSNSDETCTRPWLHS